MDLIKFLVNRSPGAIALAAIAAVISGIACTSLIALIAGVTTGSRPRGGFVAAAFIALCGVMALARYFSSISLARLVQGAVFDLRMQLSRSILAAPLRDVEKIGGHRFLAILTDDVFILANVITSIPSLAINLTLMAGCLVYLAWLSIHAFWLTFAFSVLGVLGYRLMMAPSVRIMRSAREQRDRVFETLKQLLEGAKELRLHKARRDEFVSNHLVRHADKLRWQNVNYMTWYTVANTAIQSTMFVLIAAILFSPFLFRDSRPEAMIGATLTLLFLAGPLESIVVTLPMFARANVSLKKITDCGLDLRRSDGTDQSAMREQEAWTRIDLRGVTHVYQQEDDGEQFVLGPIDLTLNRGELLFLTGGNGSGKSTLAKILTGLYEPKEGEIFIDGIPVSVGGLDQYRQLYSAVFSDFYIFEHMDYLDASIVNQHSDELLRCLELSRKVRIEDQIFRYNGLSQGQMKRMALLTACLEDRPIYVFDEWAADQDPAFKKIFYRQILPQLKYQGKTVLIVSHDDRYYEIADRIIKLNYGRIDDGYSTSTAAL
jgi:putative ATP-binding cassette transporter